MLWMLLYWIYQLQGKGKSLLDYINLFSPNKYEKKDKMIILP